jgi:hypothetical protein
VSEDEDFKTAVMAFGLFTMDERRLALQKFARLRYANIEDRFFEAVYQVIHEGDRDFSRLRQEQKA